MAWVPEFTSVPVADELRGVADVRHWLAWVWAVNMIMVVHVMEGWRTHRQPVRHTWSPGATRCHWMPQAM